MALLGQLSTNSVVSLQVNGAWESFLVIQQGNPSSDYVGFGGQTVLMALTAQFRQWHSSNINDYQNSTVHSWLNNTYLNSIDANIRNQIPTVRIPFRPGSGNSQSVNSGGSGLSTRAFLLSLREVGILPGSASQPNAEGVLFGRFINGTDANANASRVHLNLGWLRSPTANSGTVNAFYVNQDGSVTNARTVSVADRVVRPVFCLSQNMFVEESTGRIRGLAIPPTNPPSITIPEEITPEGNFVISWGASTDQNSPAQAISYILQRNLDASSWIQVASTTALNFTDSVPAGTATVAYRVLARNMLGLQSGFTTSGDLPVINNSPPQISGTDTDIGLQTTPFTYSYTVTDPDPGDTITVTERVNNTIIRQFTAVDGEPQTAEVDFPTFISLGNSSHTLTITATDQHNGTATRNITFSRSETQIEVTLKTPKQSSQTSDMPLRAAITVNRSIPNEALFTVEICNNAFDDTPTWEDCTQSVLDGSIYIFTNTTKTDDNWGVNIRIKVDRNTATAPCWISSIGGAFDSVQLYENGSSSEVGTRYVNGYAPGYANGYTEEINGLGTRLFDEMQEWGDLKVMQLADGLQVVPAAQIKSVVENMVVGIVENKIREMMEMSEGNANQVSEIKSEDAESDAK